MNNSAKIVVTVVAGLALVGGILVMGAGLSTIEDNTTKERDIKIEQVVEDDFNNRWEYSISPAEKNAFMSECTVEGGEAYCVCAYDYLDTRLTAAEFRNIANNIDSKVPDIFWDAVAACIHKL